LQNDEFIFFRKKLNKTQREMAQLLGTSIKAIHSYEQGWRNIPPHIERQMFFLITRICRTENTAAPCWTVRECPEHLRENCPAWEFNTGDLCWFINGTICEGHVHDSWREKMKSCRKCKVLKKQIPFL